ncbi:Thiamin diphosphate-binding protein [Absidia repens]|uniref:Thiamin diphosphate-binding protein n=1 Tax=Absidia repens TaxID=90262 RepID=A0A1X2IES2_9FUNG|nr:Thiamin diphosphate-binding protein [Absidia repens]
MINTRKTTIGLYLLQRLKEIGIDTVFGVPGDYNLTFLDVLEDDKEITWGNNANELNAAYAADGYARVKGAGALLTTFGVGELSAANGVAGSYAEQLPVIHIVGMPRSDRISNGALVHHSFGNGDLLAFIKIYQQLSVASALLSVSEAACQIDHVITESLQSRLPGYIGIPCDIVNTQVEVNACNKLDYSIPKSIPDVQEAALQAIITTIQQAKHPIIIADVCALRNNMKKEVAELAQVSGFPVYVTPLGIGIVDRDLPNFRGCYMGAVSLPQINAEVLGADLVLELGGKRVDTNTGVFTSSLSPSKTIEFHTNVTKVLHSSFEKVAMKELIPLVIKHFPESAKININRLIKNTLGPPAQRAKTPEGDTLIQDYFWNKIPDYLPERSVVIVETGTLSFGSMNLNIPKDSIFISQFQWASIGYSVPSTLGAAMADRSRRVFLMVGDGSFQLTVQEISVMLLHGVCPIILLFNNDGYLVEELLHAPNRKYNSFPMWQYADSFRYFGARLKINQERRGMNKSKFNIGVQKKVKTRKEFEAAMEQALDQPNCIHFLEMICPSNDAAKEVWQHTELFGV